MKYETDRDSKVEIINQLDFCVNALKVITTWANNPGDNPVKTLSDIKRQSLSVLNLIKAKGIIKLTVPDMED